MLTKLKTKILLVLLCFSLSAHAPWGQHEVYRQIHMLLMCSKTDKGAFEFTKSLAIIFEEYLPEAKARAARARDPERLANLLITNQIPLAIISNSFLSKLKKEDLEIFDELLEHSNTIYTFKNMSLISNIKFPENHIVFIAEALNKASKNNHVAVKFFKKDNLDITYNKVLFKNFKF